MTDDRAILTSAERAFLAARRVGHLATADAAGVPHVVPVCYAVDDVATAPTLYITIDQKPKGRAPLKRQRNIAENPYIAVVVDRYDEDWTRLGWVMLRGRADVLVDGAEHDAAQALLRTRYPQLRAMHIEDLPVIALRVAAVAYWGDLTPA